ncbi:uncharacterized protein [Mobula birostris]|uniref:uncharacterized protein isoform X2 n=1 Tax=Mobula birostris TaxID=1983395 RepID=UPI003B28B0D4
MLGIDGETSTYTALNFGKDDGPSSTYSVLNFRKEEDLVHEYDDPPIASGPAEPSVTPQAGAPEQESKKNIGSRSCRKVCLLCLVMSILIAIVAGLSIYVSQIRQSQTTLDRNCHELNSTLQSTMSEISDLRHQFTQMETKYKLVNDSMAQICELLTSRRDAHKQEPSENIGNRWHCKICPLCLTMFVLVAIVVGLSIYVLQLRQSLIICDRNYRRLWKQHQEMNRTQLQYQLKVHELNSTLESRISEYSRISTLENNITVLNSDLSVLNRAHTNLRHQFNHVDIKYKNITESKAQICQYLTRRREQTCFQDWIRKADRCYFISTLKTSYIEAKEHCSNFDARLLEINSKAEENIVFNALSHHYGAYRCGKCEDGEETSSLIYKYSTGRSVCVNCDSDGWRNYCNHQHRFICKKCTHSCTDIPERIQGLCQQSVGHT